MRTLADALGVAPHTITGPVDGLVAGVHITRKTHPAASRTDVEITLSRPLSVEVDGVTHEVREVHVGLDEPRLVADLVRPRTTGGANASI